MRKLQRLIAIALALCMVLSVIPSVEVSATSVTPAAKEESNLMVAIAPGDSTWVSESIPCWTVEAVDALLDLYQDNGVARIYWRGLQGEVWNQTQYNLQNGIRSTFHFEGVRRQMLEFEARVGMTIDEYVVKQAHERGMEVYGTASLADFGSGFDIPISSWPCVHNALQRMENPDWVPKDKYGLVEQGGALEYSIKAVRDWFVQMHVEEVEKVGYDGVFFITYSENYSLNYNDQFGYSDEAVQEFYDRYGIIAGKEPFTRYASINDWQHLRGEYVTELFRQMRDALDATGRDVKMSLFLDSRDPWKFQGWSPASGLLSDGIYLDLFTYVREGLIDQFVCQGACSYDAQLGTATNMLQLCEGTDIDIAVYTSSANSSVWDDLVAQGVDRVTNVSHEAMLYNRAFDGGEDSPVGSERPIRQWLAQLAESTSTLNLAGTANATLEDITPYLFEKGVNGVQGYKYSLTVRRMAIHAIKTLNLPGASDVFEQVLSTDPEPVVQAVAADGLRYVGDIDSVDELIETLYRQHEFAVIESTVIALYSNANKVAWQASLRSAFEKYAANNFDNCNTKNVRACANILRALSAGSYIDLEFYSRYVESFGPNDSTEVLLDHDLSEVQTRREPGAALAVMDDVIQELWYDALRYWATMGVGNSNTGEGFEKLFELALGDDTITSTPALVSIGNRGKSSTMVGQYRTRALEVMDQVFAACGDGSTRPDKDWVYRPLGDALKFYGDEGVKILEKHLYGEDKILALYAWRDLYIPWTPGAYNVMTEQEYEEAYLQLPDSLKEFATNSLKQDFEDQSVFHERSGGTVGNMNSTSGSWGSLNAGGVEVSDFVRESSSGTQSLKLVRDGGTSSVVTGRFPELLNGQSYKLSFWVYRTNGGIFTINSRNAVSNHEFQAFVRQDGGMYFYDNETKAWGTESVFSVPEDQWVQLTFAVSRLNAELTVSITTEDGVTQTADTKIPVNVAEGVDRIQVNMSTVSGGTAYIDDFSILTATPVMPQRSAGASISLSDETVRYDGTPHALKAVTTLMGDTVPTITYRNAYASDAEETTQAPVDAGTYLVAAITEFEGVIYTAQAKLTIAPAAPGFDASKITAESITYGQKLNESVLAMEDGAITDLNGNVLTGNIVWNNGGQYPVEKGSFGYTINPDNKNYASVSGSVQIDVIEPVKPPEVETVTNTLLSQDFEDLTFDVKGSGVVAGDKATTGGYWTRINSSVDDVDLITSQNGSKVIGLYRAGKVQKSVSVAVTDGVTSGQDFSVSFDFYCATSAGGLSVDMSEQYLFYIKANGALVFYDTESAGWSSVTQMTVPVGHWVNFRVDVASDGSFTLTMTDENGAETIAANKGSISGGVGYNAIDFNAARDAGGVIGYIDNVQLVAVESIEVEAGPKYTYTQLMVQDFDNADIFKLDNYANNKLNPADFGGNALDGASFNINDDVVTLVTEEDGNQYYSARRLLDETTNQFGVNMVSSASAGLKSCYEWSLDIKTEEDAYFTVGFGKGSGKEMSFVLGPDYIKSEDDQSKQLTFTQGEWTNIKFWADRDAGTYTFSIGNQSATVATELLGTIDVNQFAITGRGPRANNYVYIDNVSFAKADLILPYEVVEVEITDTVQMYTGSEKTVSINAGAATEYTVWYNGSTEAPIQPGTYEVQVVVTEKGYRGSSMGTLTIEQADVAVLSDALTYVEVAKGTTLSAVELGISFGTEGTFAWEDVATAALSISDWYDWSFTPENSNYKSVAGSVYVNVQNGEDAVAQVGQTTYASVALAVEKAATGSTVTMIANTAETGFVVDKNVTIDFAGKSLQVTAGTIELAPDAMVVFKNGTITGNGGTLLQNAADLTLTDMVLSTSGTAIFNGPGRALTVNYTYIPEAITVTGGITIKDAAMVNISGGIFTASIKDGWCAGGYQGVANGDGTYTVMDKDLCNAAKIGNAYFATLDEAVNAAVDGTTITMLRDADVGHLLLTGAVTLDLNGYTLAAPDAVVAISGQIIDSTDGEGAVITPVKNVLLHENNSYLPLYDSALGGYRFYSYSFDMLGVRTDGATGNPVFGLRLRLNNVDGYALMADPDCAIQIRVRLTWEGMNVAAPEFVFGSDLVATYAHYMQTVPYYALLLRVGGAEGKNLTVEGFVQTQCRVQATADPFSFNVPITE